MTRALPEWVGKTDDSRPPPRVRVRIFESHNGVCHISKRKIAPGEPWECEHITAIINGGENRESNMAPALIKPHKEKTARDVAIKAKNDRVRKRHLGLRKPSRFPGSRDSKFKKKISGEVILR